MDPIIQIRKIAQECKILCTQNQHKLHAMYPSNKTSTQYQVEDFEHVNPRNFEAYPAILDE